jgi:pimeloyl-ACP methyl ester carboxylesterase
MSWILSVLCAVIYFILIIFACLVIFAPSILYWPVKDIQYIPNKPYRDLWLDNRIHAWHFNSYPHEKTVLFCHGSGGNISERDYLIDICEKQRLNLLMFDYSGFGRSLGSPHSNQLLEDGRVAYRYLLNEGISVNRIILWGESMGGAIATKMAEEFGCHSLVLMATFSSLDDILRQRGGYVSAFLGMTARLILPNTLPTVNILGKLHCPIIIAHSVDDDLIPFKCAEENFKRISHPRTLFLPIKGSHFYPDFTSEDLEKLFSFCDLDVTRAKELDYILHRLRTPLE